MHSAAGGLPQAPFLVIKKDPKMLGQFFGFVFLCCFAEKTSAFAKKRTPKIESKMLDRNLGLFLFEKTYVFAQQ